MGKPTQNNDPNPYAPGYVHVPLSNGGHAIVDEEDYSIVVPYNWQKVKHGNSYYAFAHAKRNGKNTTISMHRLLFGLSKEDRIDVDHKNHDGLDNRRSENLRLATRVQNATNMRRRRGSSSKYKGVSFNQRSNKWVSAVRIKPGPALKRLGLGYYDIEEEAAFAYSVAAPLVMDPDYVHVSVIPDSLQPTPDRQNEIRSIVVAKVKAGLAGNKARLGATSKYHNVFLQKGGTWRPIIRANKGMISLGQYPSEIEAAFAYNVARGVFGGDRRRINLIPGDQLPNEERAAQIKTQVARIIEARTAGHKGLLDQHSQYRGVTYSKKDRGWVVNVKIQQKGRFFGIYRHEAEAAFAYNMVAHRLGKPENNIPRESSPSDERSQEIYSYIQRRIDGIPVT
jgi:hypothetical protein